MRTIAIIAVQLLVSLFVTASVMPFVLVTTPAAQRQPAVGLTLMAALLVVTFTLVSLVWPKRMR